MGETRAWGVRARGFGCAGGFLRALASARARPPRSPRPSCARLCRQCRNERAQATQRGTRAGRDVVCSWLRRELGMRSWLRRELGSAGVYGARARPCAGTAPCVCFRDCARLGRNRVHPDPLCPFVSSVPKRTGSSDSKGHTRRARRGVRWTRRGAAPARRTRRGGAGAARRRLSAPGELLDASQRVPRRACQASGALYPGDRTGL